MAGQTKVERMIRETRARVASNVLKLRQDKKLSQTDLAEKAGLSVSYVSMLERGKRDMSVETVCKLAVAFDVQPSAIGF